MAALTVQPTALTVPLGYPSLQARLQALHQGASLVNPYGKVNVADVLEALASQTDRRGEIPKALSYEDDLREFATEEVNLDDDEEMEAAFDEYCSEP